MVRSLDMFSLDGKVAVVTGAAGLIGRHHCAALAAAGASVIAVDLVEETAVAVADELGPEHMGQGADVTSERSLQALLASVMERYGALDILVNNAAINDMVENPLNAAESSRFENYPVDLFRRVLEVNVTGMFLCCQILGATMAQQGGGSIINLASTYGVVAPDQRIYQAPDGTQSFFKSAAYPVSKGAVVMLTKFLASYWGPQNVRVNTLSPGGVENGQPEHFVDAYSARTPLGRMATADDYMGAVVFLASDASSYLTGHNLIVDGGWTAW